MKKFTLVLFTLFLSLSLFSQNCVTDYRSGDFGLQSVFGEIVFLKVAPDSNKWFGIKNNFAGGYGIGKFDGTNWTAFNSGNSELPDDRVYDIAFDTSGNVWVATYFGLAKFNGDSATGWEIYDKVDFGTAESQVSSIAIDSGYVKWIGLHSGKVIRYNDTTWTVFNEWTNGPVNVINVDSSHNIWCGMDNTPGLAMYDHASWTTYPQYSYIRSIQFRGTSDVYASDFDRIHVYNGAEWTEISNPNFSIFYVTINKNEEVWLSSTIGLLQLKDGLFIPYNKLNSGMPDFLLFSHPCAFDQEDKLWFSYQYTNVNSYCATGFLKENDGLGLEVLSDKNFVFCDGDSTVLDAGSGFSIYKWSTGETSDTIIVYESDTINVAVTDGSGCWDYDTVKTFKHEVYGQEKICVVTVVGGQNVVVWERTADMGTEFYNVYKETEVADEYEIIDFVPFTALSVFVDPDSKPKIHSERYKITAVDTCGNESELSAHHKTMHLTLNVGVGGVTNLIWENYEGFDFPSYIIYRGTRADNMVQRDIIPSNLTTYTDTDFGEFYYRVEVVMPGVCSPAAFLKAGAGPYSHALSNVEDNRLQINLPPSEIYLSDSVLLEGQPAGTFVGKFTTYDPDSTGTFEYSLAVGEGDDDNISFTISHDSLFSAAVLDYDVKVIYNLRVRSTDSKVDTLWTENKFRVHLTSLDNEAPTDISLDNNEIAEGQIAGTFIGKFTTTDPDVGDKHTYSLVEGDGWPDNGSFSISSDSLFSDEVFDYDTKATFNIRVRTTDDGPGLLYFEKQFVINITAGTVNTAPTDITLSENSLDEKQDIGTLVGRFTTTDADAGDTHTYSLVSGDGDDDNSSFTITNDSLVSAEVFDYYTKNSYSVRVRSTDEGSLHFEKQFTILVFEAIEIGQVRNDLRIYPIPLTDRLTIGFPYLAGQDYKLVITDLNGQRIKMINKIQTGSIELDASDLAPGIYILELRGPELLRARIVKTQ